MYLWRRSGWKVERDKCGERFSREKGREFSAWIIFSFSGKLMTEIFRFLSLSHHHRRASPSKGHPQKLSSVLLRLFRLFNPHIIHRKFHNNKKTASNNNNQQWRTIASRDEFVWMVQAESLGWRKICPFYLDHNCNDRLPERRSIEVQLLRRAAVSHSILSWWTFCDSFSSFTIHTLATSQQIKADYFLIIKTLSSIIFALYVKTSAEIA